MSPNAEATVGQVVQETGLREQAFHPLFFFLDVVLDLLLKNLHLRIEIFVTLAFARGDFGDQQGNERPRGPGQRRQAAAS